ncbi:MAG: hypothetical protein COV08_01725 [Candidatus Vogelbacteria bacterium CG10_big_fil_rev_8_21_14_0_10_49_38]|uniref:Glycosyltransferase 2-like domain-containing protein n=1 Tax=Candidatus Vogelbacteria bacterium CG10_big_fil_rev_8_21_14_0_10_49_38 TaxID=1975043 RepID=A0A2H0RI40_9BACT|nr:MAG: hypothetical protein BK006_01740 [bacterium CG10_49_38]PIR46117.1 MAG: hypothetical protein COV08_01725 [Candidatus Vogelbacteria bacterium CG10_big_fil_rev_8_21_14_0_10_49_38]
MDQTAEKLKPRVSINLPAYNRASFLPATIESVLKQSFTDWELLIFDDGSTDNTKEVLIPFLTDPRINYHKNETNLGICRTRNLALQASRGQYVAVLDSDDLWLDSDKLKQQVEFLDTHLDHNLIGTGVIELDQANQELKRHLPPVDDEAIRKIILEKNPFAHSSVMYRREVALGAGGYPENLDGIEDYDLWFKLGRHGKFANLGTFALGYRRHPGNISQTARRRLMKENLFLIKKYRHYYPGFLWAWVRRASRLFLIQLLVRFGINF